MSKAEKSALSKLGQLMHELDPIIKQHLSGLTAPEAEALLNQHRAYLKIDLVRDIEAAQRNSTGLHFNNASPFDDIMNEYLDKK